MSAVGHTGEDPEDETGDAEHVIATYEESDGLVFYSEDEPRQWILIENPVDVERMS